MLLSWISSRLIYIYIYHAVKLFHKICISQREITTHKLLLLFGAGVSMENSSYFRILIVCVQKVHINSYIDYMQAYDLDTCII